MVYVLLHTFVQYLYTLDVLRLYIQALSNISHTSSQYYQHINDEQLIMAYPTYVWYILFQFSF